jgi:hypothetical protein
VKDSKELKDLRVFVGRLEANATALEVALASYPHENVMLTLNMATLKTLVAEIRQSIDRLEDKA